MSGNRVCPVCGKNLKGPGWIGIDGHWPSHRLIYWEGKRVRHEEVESYEDAKDAGLLLDRWQPPEKRKK